MRYNPRNLNTISRKTWNISHKIQSLFVSSYRSNQLANYGLNIRQFSPRNSCQFRLFSTGLDSTVSNDKDKPENKNSLKDIKHNNQSIAPGLIFSVMTASCGFMIADTVGPLMLSLQGIEGVNKSPLSGIPVSILLGLLLRNGVLPRVDKYYLTQFQDKYNVDNMYTLLEPGVKFSTTTILRSGIICVGLKLSGADLLSSASVAIPLVVASISVGLTTGIVLSQLAGLPSKMGTLIAAGTSICGVTAITALAPVINANERDVAYAIATVVAFGTTAMLSYPYLAHYIFDNSQSIGLFLGCAIHDTSQVIGSALTYSQVYSDEEVLKVAAITKLTRNLALAGVIPLLAWQDQNNNNQKKTETSQQTVVGDPRSESSVSCNNSKSSISLSTVSKFFPPFVGGFICMAGIRTLGDATIVESTLNGGVSTALWGTITAMEWNNITTFIGSDVGGKYLLGTAMAGVGLSTGIKALKGVGMSPFIVGGTAALCVGATGFVMVNLLV